jgi:hypothetical protein
MPRCTHTGDRTTALEDETDCALAQLTRNFLGAAVVERLLPQGQKEPGVVNSKKPVAASVSLSSSTGTGSPPRTRVCCRPRAQSLH